jgi:integrase
VSIKEKQNGKFKVAVSYRLRGTKSPKQLQGTASTLKEAEALETELKKQAEELRKDPAKFDLLRQGKQSVPEYFGHWIEYHAAKNNLQNRTRSGYNKLYKKWVVPYFAGIKLTDLTENTIVRALEPFADNRDSYERKYYSLNSALKDASQRGIILVNPMLDIPKPKGRTQRENSKNKSLEDKDRRKLVEGLKATSCDNPLNDTYKIAIGMALTTGMRTSELRAITWDRVMQTNKGIYFRVDRAMEEAGHDNVFKSTKNEKVRNTFYIPTWLCELIRRHKKLQAEKMKELRIKDDRGFVLLSLRPFLSNHNADPLPIKEQQINANLRRWQEKYDIDLGEDDEGKKIQLSVYNLRHTFATYQHKAGKHKDIDVATSMGDTLNTFLKTYVNASETERERSSETADELY